MFRIKGLFLHTWLIVLCLLSSDALSQDDQQRVWLEPSGGILVLNSDFFTTPLAGPMAGPGSSFYFPTSLPGLGWKNSRLTSLGVGLGFKMNERIAFLFQYHRFITKESHRAG